MTLDAARARFAVLVITLILSISGAIIRAQTPVRLPDDRNSLESPAANEKRPEDTTQRIENSRQPAETVKWTDVYIWRLMAFGIGVQVIGFALVWWQVGQLKRGIQGETHSRLYDHYLKITERLAAEKDLRAYFYDPKVELKEGAANYADLRDRIDMMCEVILGLLEHAAVQEKNLPKDSWEACWEKYTHERFDKSLELRKFLRDNHGWYAKSFCRVVAERYPHLIKVCGCTIDVAAANADCPAPTPTAPVGTTSAESVRGK